MTQSRLTVVLCSEHSSAPLHLFAAHFHFDAANWGQLSQYLNTRKAQQRHNLKVQRNITISLLRPGASTNAQSLRFIQKILITLPDDFVTIFCNYSGGVPDTIKKARTISVVYEYNGIDDYLTVHDPDAPLPRAEDPLRNPRAEDLQTLEMDPTRAANTTYNQVRLQFRRLALKYHPDKSPHTHQEFVRMNEAYQRLTKNILTI